MWDNVKAVLRGGFIAIQAYLKKKEESQVNNLTLHLSTPHSTTFAWRIPWREEPGRLQFKGSQRVGHD